MRLPSTRSLPSVGIWLALLSWGWAAAFLLWGAREPRLDRMRRELDALAMTEGATASEWLIGELTLEMARRPRLVAKLAGETGARALEARRDGSTRSPRFHVVTTAEATKILVTGTARGQLELAQGAQIVSAAVEPGRTVELALPDGVRGRPGLWTARRGGEDGELLIVGDLTGEAP